MKKNCAGRFLFIATCLTLFFTPSARSDLSFLKPGKQETGKFTYSLPTGFRCSFEYSPKSNISFGVGISKPQILNGQSIGGITNSNGDLLSETVVVPTTLSDVGPTAGILVQIPLGGRPKRNCDHALELYEQQSKYENAQLMFELGIIDEDELRVIGRDYYQLMLKKP